MMNKHVKIYLNHFDIGEADTWYCEGCMKPDHIQSLEIHHIYGRGKDKDVITNLMCLCRKCHERAHGGIHPVSKGEFQLIHGYFLMGQRKSRLK